LTLDWWISEDTYDSSWTDEPISYCHFSQPSEWNPPIQGQIDH